MSGKNKHQERIKEFFKLYKEEDTCLVASDGQIFQKKAANWAKNHADSNGLKIEEVERPSAKASSKDKGGSTDEPENTTPNFSKMKKADLIAYAKEHDIEINIGTNDEIIKQIEDFLNANFDPDKVEDEGTEGSEDTEENAEGEFTPTENAEK